MKRIVSALIMGIMMSAAANALSPQPEISQAIPQAECVLSIPKGNETHLLKVQPEFLKDRRVWLKLEKLPRGILQVGSYTSGFPLQVGPVLTAFDNDSCVLRLPIRTEVTRRGPLCLRLGHVELPDSDITCYVCLSLPPGGAPSTDITIMAAVKPEPLEAAPKRTAPTRSEAPETEKPLPPAPAEVLPEESTYSPGFSFTVFPEEGVENAPSTSAQSATATDIPARPIDKYLVPGLIALIVVMACAIIVVLWLCFRGRGVVFHIVLNDEGNREVCVRQNKLSGWRRYSLGRSNKCSLQLRGGTVSSVHGELRFAHDKLLYVDKQSSNGSRHNGVMLKPLVPVEIKPGDQVSLGNTRITINW